MVPIKFNSNAELRQDTPLEFEKFCKDGEREMISKWRNQTFHSLSEFSKNNEYRPGSSYEVWALRNRYKQIKFMLEEHYTARGVAADRIWPPSTSTSPLTWGERFRAALRDVLRRLPQGAFDGVYKT